MGELLTGQGPIIAGGATSVVFTTPFPHRPGERARDRNGNEYMFVDYTGTVVTGSPVLISDDNTAAVIGLTGRGRFGVACGGGTSDNAGWVQIYGRARVLFGTEGSSVSNASLSTLSTSLSQIFVLPTSITSPVGMDRVTAPSDARSRHILIGVTLASDASPSVASDDETSLTSTSITVATISVFLNYPYIRYEYLTS